MTPAFCALNLFPCFAFSARNVARVFACLAAASSAAISGASGEVQLECLRFDRALFCLRVTACWFHCICTYVCAVEHTAVFKVVLFVASGGRGSQGTHRVATLGVPRVAPARASRPGRHLGKAFFARRLVWRAGRLLGAVCCRLRFGLASLVSSCPQRGCLLFHDVSHISALRFQSF